MKEALRDLKNKSISNSNKVSKKKRVKIKRLKIQIILLITVIIRFNNLKTKMWRIKNKFSKLFPSQI